MASIVSPHNVCTFAAKSAHCFPFTSRMTLHPHFISDMLDEIPSQNVFLTGAER